MQWKDARWTMKETLKVLGLTALATAIAPAATISWQPAVANTTESDIITGGTLVVASNSAGATDQTINGVTFTAQGGGPLASNAAGTFYTTGSGANTTGSASLDALLDSHSYVAGSGSFTFDITGLNVGDSYDIQIFAVGDTRGCCSTRTQSFSGDGVVFSDLLSRNDPSSVVGSFVADAEIQTITVNGPTDPGLSGFQVRNVTGIPEPSAFLLAGLSGLSLLLRRRK